jgi:FkbM family methyltransferase
MDWLGAFLRGTPQFPGKWRVTRAWERGLRPGERRLGQLPDGSVVEVAMGVPYERMVWLQGEEWDDLCYLRWKLRPGDLFVDVGANLGLWTLVAAGRVGEAGRVISFEPNPATHERLLANIARNELKNVEAVPAAVAREEGEVWFACRAEHNTSGISAEAGEAGAIRVPAVALDDAVVSRAGERRVSGIKLDTEGHELEALQGAEALIRRDWPWLVVEFNTTLLQSRRLGDWAVYVWLRSLGYGARAIGVPGGEVPVGEDHAVEGYTNLLFERVGARD